MITQHERETLAQWYTDYSANNSKPMGYVTWLEYMLIHRTSLLQQSAEYADSLEAALDEIGHELKSVGDSDNAARFWQAIVNIVHIADKAKGDAE